MRLLIIIASLLMSVNAQALEAVVGFGPLFDTNVPAWAKGGKTNAVLDIDLRKTEGWWLPFVGIQTLFGDHAGRGGFDPVVNTWRAGIRFKLTENLFIVADHWSRHTVDSYRPTEKFTALKLEHIFRIGGN